MIHLLHPHAARVYPPPSWISEYVVTEFEYLTEIVAETKLCVCRPSDCSDQDFSITFVNVKLDDSNDYAL